MFIKSIKLQVIRTKRCVQASQLIPNHAGDLSSHE